MVVMRFQLELKFLNYSIMPPSIVDSNIVCTAKIVVFHLNILCTSLRKIFHQMLNPKSVKWRTSIYEKLLNGTLEII